MESHMLCLKHRKSLKGRKPEKIISLSSVKKKYSVKKPLSRVSKKHSKFFAECQKKRSERILYRVFFLPSFFRAALGKEPLCRVPDKKHSAKRVTLGKDAVSGSAKPIKQSHCSIPK